MSLTLKDVAHIAALARLKLSEAQMEHYRGQLSTILDHIAKLQELDTQNVPPTTGGGLTSMPLRVDEPRPSLDPSTLLKTAPQTSDDQFQVPPVFE